MYLAQYTYNTTNTSSGVGLGLMLVYLVLIIVFLTALWKVFTKAGVPGWKALIPIYNAIMLLRIVGYSAWYFLLYLIPIINIVFSVMVAYKLAIAFGYGIGMTILNLLGIGYLILGFGSAKYLGPDGQGTAVPQSPPAKPQQPAPAQ